VSETLVQAIIRLVVVFIVAGLTAVAANLTILANAVSDPIYSALVVAIGTAVISAILKYLGGPTQPVTPVVEPVAALGRAASAAGTVVVKRPNWLAI
jgi:hypothetical protein